MVRASSLLGTLAAAQILAMSHLLVPMAHELPSVWELITQSSQCPQQD